MSAGGRPVARSVRRSVRRAAQRVRWSARRVLLAWRTSMQLRVTSTAIGFGLLAVMVLSTYLSGAIRDGLFEQRITQVLTESSRSTAQAQTAFNTTSATTTTGSSSSSTTWSGCSRAVGPAVARSSCGALTPTRRRRSSTAARRPS